MSEDVSEGDTSEQHSSSDDDEKHDVEVANSVEEVRIEHLKVIRTVGTGQIQSIRKML